MRARDTVNSHRRRNYISLFKKKKPLHQNSKQVDQNDCKDIYKVIKDFYVK